MNKALTEGRVCKGGQNPPTPVGKRPPPPKGSKSACQHLWNYVHAVYGGPKGGTLVRRYCEHCPTEQVGVVERWRDPHPDEFDETAKEATR